jgi:hypothetical protein
MNTPRFAFVAALSVLGAGCTPAQQTPAPDPRIPALDTANATCTGRFSFTTDHQGAGQSQCRDDAAGPFTAYAQQALAAGLVCNYTLNYTDPKEGTGEVACSDGSIGTLTFHRTPQFRGDIVVQMKDGRELHLTFTQEQVSG